MKPVLAATIALAAFSALNFGINTVNFNTSKDFAVIDFGWCEGESTLYSCPKAKLYGGLITGMVFVGAALGSYFIGVFSKRGRRFSLYVLNSVNIVGCLICASSTCFYMLLLGRFIAGIGVGMCGFVPIYISEIAPPKQRGLYGTIYPVFITFGQVFITAYQLIHGRVVDAHTKLSLLDKFIWRSALGMPIIFSVISLLLVFFVVKDETPLALARANKHDEAKRVIQKMHREDCVQDFVDVIALDLESVQNAEAISLWEALKDKRNWRPICVCLTLALLQQLSGINVFMANSTQVFVSIIGRTFKATVLGSSCCLLNFLITTTMVFYVDKVGRRTLLLLSTIISTVFLLPCSVVLWFVKDNTTLTTVFLSIGSVGFIAGFAIGMGGVIWIYFTEAFGVDYKDSGFGFCVMNNWIGAAATVIVSDYVLDYSPNAFYTSFAVVSLFCVAFVYLYVRETKGIAMGTAYRVLKDGEANEE